MAVYSVFRALGLDVMVRAVLDYDKEELREEWSYDSDNDEDRVPADLVRDITTGLEISQYDCLEGFGEALKGWCEEETEVQWLNRPNSENLNVGFVFPKVCIWSTLNEIAEYLMMF